MPKESKWTGDVYGEGNGPKKPISNEWDKKDQSSMSINPMTILGHCNQLREEYTIGPKEAQQAWIK